MAAFFRFVSLIGVIAAGFYVLYLTQARLSEPQSLTQSGSEGAAPVTLEAEGETSGPSEPEADWKTVKAGSPPPESEIPGGTDSPEMFSARSAAPFTVVSEAGPGSADGLDFRDETVTAEKEPESALGIVDAAVANAEPEVITLTGNENPFLEEAPAESAETEKPPAFENADPFDARDPFDAPTNNADKPAPKPETEAALFDPFGEDANEPEPFTAEASSDEKPADRSPESEPQPGTSRAVAPGPKTETANETPNPFTADDPFSTLSGNKTNAADTTKPATAESPAKKPAVSSDPFESPFPEFPAQKPAPEKAPAKNAPVAPQPVPANDPFGEPFPDLKPLDKTPSDRESPEPIEAPTPSFNPFGESPAEEKPVSEQSASFPDFPAEFPEKNTEPEEAETSDPATALDRGFDPFAEETSAPKPADDAEKPQPSPAETDDFPAFEPLETPATGTPPERNEVPEREAPERTEALPSLDEFSDLDEKLKKRVEEDERSREATPSPEPAPEFPAELPSTEPMREVPAELPGETGRDESTPPEELRSAPTGIVPSLTDLQGDGVLPPEAPRKVQLPYLEIKKTAPEKALLNQPFVYTIVVRNVGDAAANEVTVQDQIPKGANLTGTIPQAELVGRRLVWKLGRIEPGEEQKVAVRVVPVDSGPIGSVATVNFVAEVGAETVVEHPEVAFQMALPSQADVGEVVECRFEIENRGSKLVSGIVLRDVIPAGLHHPAGNDLENPLGDLKPGEKITEVLELKVMKAGEHVNQAVLTAEGGLEIKQVARLEATGNRLVILRRGPKERFVGRPAVYQNVVKNSSHETVHDAVVIERLPAGMQFEQAGQGGQYHAASREIYWKIAQIGPGQAVALDVQMTPVKPGVGESLVRVRESQGKEIQTVSHTQVRSYASIGLEVTEFDQPVLVGDTVVMRVEATNRGNASANTVQLRAKIPPTLQLMTVRGKTRFKVVDRDVVFETLQALPAGETEIIELELQAAAPSTAEVSVGVQSRGMSKPLVKTAEIPVHSRR